LVTPDLRALIPTPASPPHPRDRKLPPTHTPRDARAEWMGTQLGHTTDISRERAESEIHTLDAVSHKPVLFNNAPFSLLFLPNQ